MKIKFSAFCKDVKIMPAYTVFGVTAGERNFKLWKTVILKIMELLTFPMISS